MRLDVAFMQRDRRFAAVKYYPHAPAKGFTHDDAGVHFHPGATSLTQRREANSHAGFQFRVVVVHSAPDMMRREQATSLMNWIERRRLGLCGRHPIDRAYHKRHRRALGSQPRQRAQSWIHRQRSRCVFRYSASILTRQRSRYARRRKGGEQLGQHQYRRSQEVASASPVERL